MGLVAGVAVVVAACSSGGSGSGPAAVGRSVEADAVSGHVKGSLTVWVDAVRLPVAQAYARSHPKVHVHIVTFDGDGNGATTMQTKIQLWNRTGRGWPDVIFSEQVNDPVWMAQPPFNYAQPLGGLFPQNLLSKWPAPSTA